MIVGMERAAVVGITVGEGDAFPPPGLGEGALLLGGPGHDDPPRVGPERACGRAREQRRWHERQSVLVGTEVRSPGVAHPGGMEARRRDDQTALGLEVEAGGQHGRGRGSAAQGEPHVAAAAAGRRLDRLRQGPELGLEPFERRLATMTRVDVEDDEVGDRARHDRDIRSRPAPPPAGDLGGRRPSGHARLPADRGMLAGGRAIGRPARAAARDRDVDRDHRPAACGVVEGRGQTRRLCFHRRSLRSPFGGLPESIALRHRRRIGHPVRPTTTFGPRGPRPARWAKVAHH